MARAIVKTGCHAIVLALFAALAGCGSGTVSPPSGKSLDCFPEEARRWIWQSALKKKEGADRLSQPMAAKMATIYVDRSASMVGYLNGADQFSRPLQDLLGNLPTMIGAAGAKSQFRAFGRSISEPLAGGAKLFQDNGFYSCAKGQQNCESSESHLDQVLRDVAARSGDFSVVLSDLWYDNSGDATSGVTSLQEPLTKILADGRAIALYGIEAPFNGNIYSVPTGPTQRTTFKVKGKHPLFMLAIGSKNDVLEFGEQLKKSGSRLIAEGVNSGTIKQSIFTVDPGPLTPVEKSPVTPGKDPGFSVNEFESLPGIRVQGFKLTKQLPAKAGQARPEPARWSAPKDSDFLPNTVWKGDLVAKIDVYQRLNTQCLPKTSWQKLNPLVDGETIPAEGVKAGKYEFAFDPAKLSSRLLQKGVYLVSGRLERKSVQSPNPANAWAKSWSVRPETAALAMQQSTAIYPTLNLEEVVRIMENSLATATERKGGGIVGFNILVQVQD